MRTLRTTRLAALALVAAATACVEEATQPTAVEIEPDEAFLSSSGRPDLQLTILHNNDAESDLLPGDEFGGVARFGRTVDDLRAEATTDCEIRCAVVLLSAGDNFLAGPEFNASLENGIFYDVVAQDLIGFDASAIGNHEFDFGPDVLADYIDAFEMTSPPFLSANLDVGGEAGLAALESGGRIARSTILEVPVFGPEKRSRRRWHRGYDDDDDDEDDEFDEYDDDEDDDKDDRRRRVVRIGVIGATTPELRTISSPRNVEVLQDVARRVNREAFRLRRRGVDKIILISHLQGLEGMNGDLELIPQLIGVDVAIAGGGDELLANPSDEVIPGSDVFGPYPLSATDRLGRPIPVITTSGAYRYVGRLSVTFSRRGRVLESTGGPVLVQGAADPEIEAMVEAPIAAAVAQLQATVVGTTEVELDGNRPNVRSRETNVGDLVADALLWQANQLASDFGVGQADVALQNGGGIRNSVVIPAGGDITEFLTFRILPFPNFVSIVPDISRTQFKQILERTVSADTDPTTGALIAEGRFAQVAGFTIVYDPAQTAQTVDDDTGDVLSAGSRVRDVVLDDGTVIVADGAVIDGPALNIATIDFLARGGDAYPYAGAPFTAVGVTYQQALRNYVQNALAGVVTAGDYPKGGEGRITVPTS